MTDILERLDNLIAKMFGNGNWGQDLDTIKDAKAEILKLKARLEATKDKAEETILDLMSKLRAAERKLDEESIITICALGQAHDAYEAQLAAEAKLAEVTAERDDLSSVLDKIESDNRLGNGNFWRFWSDEARKHCHARQAAEAVAEKLRGAMIQMRDDKTGFRHAVHFRRFITAALTETATTEERNG